MEHAKRKKDPLETITIRLQRSVVRELRARGLSISKYVRIVMAEHLKIKGAENE